MLEETRLRIREAVHKGRATRLGRDRDCDAGKARCCSSGLPDLFCSIASFWVRPNADVRHCAVIGDRHNKSIVFNPRRPGCMAGVKATFAYYICLGTTDGQLKNSKHLRRMALYGNFNGHVMTVPLDLAVIGNRVRIINSERRKSG